MKKINNNQGFVLAETLVVTIFLMVIFTTIYSNLYPLIGEYEKRETYDDVDSIYSIYWIKKIIEDSSYDFTTRPENLTSLDLRKYIRFTCDDVSEVNDKRDFCKKMLKELEVEGCDNTGNNCNIFLTPYQIGNATATDFKATVENNLKIFQENCFEDDTTCRNNYITNCNGSEYCENRADKNVFRTRVQSYVKTLADYLTPSLNSANYRIIVSFQHKKDNNNFYSYATIEVIK